MLDCNKMRAVRVCACSCVSFAFYDVVNCPDDVSVLFKVRCLKGNAFFYLAILKYCIKVIYAVFVRYLPAGSVGFWGLGWRSG